MRLSARNIIKGEVLEVIHRATTRTRQDRRGGRHRQQEDVAVFHAEAMTR
jgi:hypothetical protein